MNNMSWLDLYNYLHSQAHDFKNLGKFDWNSPVMIHDASTGDETYCDTWIITDQKGEDKVVLATNIESVFADSKKGNS
jgi:hypothetical protein